MTDDITCECGKIYDWEENISWVYYPKFDRLLCYNCIKYIHYRLSAEYVLKLVGEFNYRKWDIKNISKYFVSIKEILSLIHRNKLNNKSAIYILRQILDTEKTVSEIDISNIPNLDKVQKKDIINRGITGEHAKMLTIDKNIAIFFERVAHNNFRIENDYITYISDNHMGE